MEKTNHDAAPWLAAVAESSDDAIISKDLDGVIRSWNAGAERLFGFAPDEAVGQPITIIIFRPDSRQHSGFRPTFPIGRFL